MKLKADDDGRRKGHGGVATYANSARSGGDAGNSNGEDDDDSIDMGDKKMPAYSVLKGANDGNNEYDNDDDSIDGGDKKMPAYSVSNSLYNSSLPSGMSLGEIEIAMRKGSMTREMVTPASSTSYCARITSSSTPSTAAVASNPRNNSNIDKGAEKGIAKVDAIGVDEKIRVSPQMDATKADITEAGIVCTSAALRPGSQVYRPQLETYAATRIQREQEKANSANGGGNSSTSSSTATLPLPQDKYNDQHNEEQQQKRVSRPGAFFVAGMEAGTNQNAWDSCYGLNVEGSLDEDDAVPNQSRFSTIQEDEMLQSEQSLGRFDSEKSLGRFDIDTTRPERISDFTNSSNTLAHDSLVTVIDDDELHKTIGRDILMENTIHAHTVDIIDELKIRKQEIKKALLWIFSVLIIIGLVIGLSIGLTRSSRKSTSSETPNLPTKSPTLSPTHNPLPTLEIIQNRDMVRCGVQWFVPFETDLCRALAAAVLGDPKKIKIYEISKNEEDNNEADKNEEDRWSLLEEERTVDVITMASFSMNRDVYQESVKSGFTFSDPYLYSKLAFGGIPEYVECADKLDTYFGPTCSSVRICARDGSAAHTFLSDMVDSLHLRAVPYNEFYASLLRNNSCNVLFDSLPYISTSRIESVEQEYQHATGGSNDDNKVNYTMGTSTFLNISYSMVTRDDDPQWADFINWVLRALMAADGKNITSATASNFMTTKLFGDEYENMFVNAIEAVGNYGELYQKHIELLNPTGAKDDGNHNPSNSFHDKQKGFHYAYALLPSSAEGPNLVKGSTMHSISDLSSSLQDKEKGLHFAYPILPGSVEGPDPVEGSTMFSITQNRGALRCGIFERIGFGKKEARVSMDSIEAGDNDSRNGNSTITRSWNGMDADYCYALSASLFEGNESKVEFIDLTSPEDGFRALDSGEVDVLAGGRVTLEADVNGFTFSIPYYYSPEHPTVQYTLQQKLPVGAISMVTRDDDSQWSDFVFWVVAGTFIAEENSITQAASQDMVDAPGFGPKFVNTHRHAIAAVGNYGEIYERSLETILQRGGRNLLNTNPLPHHFSFF